MSEQSTSGSGRKLNSLDLAQAIQAVKEGNVETVKQFFVVLKKEFSYDGVLEDLERAGIFRVTPARKYLYNIEPGPDPEKALVILPDVDPKKALDILLLKSYALALQTGDERVQDALSNCLQDRKNVVNRMS